MHCPNCRVTNASTTRFCTGCGAVLVESAPGGARRRVLRPWGLRRSAPRTESPALPELADARAAARRASGRPARKLGVFLAGGIAVTAVAGTLVYPYANPHEAAPPRNEATAVIVDAPLVPLSTSRESRLSAPPLVEAISPPAHDARSDPSRADGSSRKVQRVAPVAIAPVAEAIPASEPIVEPSAVIEPPPQRLAPLPELPAAPVDRLAPLRDALRGCGVRDGLFERATCEQRARIDHCAGHWGEAPLCPSGRNEHTQ